MTTTSVLLSRLRDRCILAGWQVNELKRIGDPQTLGRQLLKRGWLTPFQVNQLLAGRWDSLVVGPYVLLERLGKGGMGQVFKAWHIHLARLTALKVLRRERSRDPDIVSRFHREVQAVAQLAHPNIVRAYDADEVNGVFYLAMEYVDGVNLSQLVRQRGPLPLAEACDYIRQAARGLQHAYERGMVHRDIKPSNLLVTRPRPDGERTLKILDLGLARLDDMPADDATLTLPGMVIGTPDYLSPEQATDPRQADIRSDLYSLGCTFYFLVTGSVPFPGGLALEKIVCHRTREPRPAESLRHGLPGPVAAIIRRLMAKSPAGRPATPVELAAELDQLVGRCGDSGSGSTSLTWTSDGAPTLSLAQPWPGKCWRLLSACVAGLTAAWKGAFRSSP